MANINLHCHSTRSDGRLTPFELVCNARMAGIRILAITDHNYTEPLDALRRSFPDMTLVQGAEISCIYQNTAGKELELHVVALGFDPENREMKALLERNRPDRRPYINAILARLRENGVDLGTYENIRSRFPENRYIGRMALARCMFEDGYTSSIDEAFGIYLSAHGERRAYVENNLRYGSLEETVDIILRSGGVAVLAHLLYFGLEPFEQRILLEKFRSLTGNRGAMEVYYSRYNWDQVAYLQGLSLEYHLYPSAGSDYHGQEQWETLNTNIPTTHCAGLLNCLNIRME